MKVLVISDLPPYVMGGAESQAARLIDAWIDLGLEVECAAHRTPHGLFKLSRNAVHVTHLSARSDSRAIRAVKYGVSLSRWLLKHSKSADLIYCRFLTESALTVVTLKALGLIKQPLVACPGCFGESGDANIIRSLPGWRFLIPLINKYCDAINILADPIADELKALGIHAPLFVRMPNAIEIQPLIKTKPRKKGLRFIFAGRCERAKGIDVLLEAWQHVLSNEDIERPLSLTIAGDGSLRKQLQDRAIELGISKTVDFIGPIPFSEMRGLISSHDVLLLPSREEGFSNVALEAMESGVPVVVSAIGGIDTFIDKNAGWVVKPGDVHSLYEVLVEICRMDQDDLVNYGQNSRAVAQERFNIEVVARQHRDLFQRLLQTDNTLDRPK